MIILHWAEPQLFGKSFYRTVSSLIIEPKVYYQRPKLVVFVCWIEGGVL